MPIPAYTSVLSATDLTASQVPFVDIDPSLDTEDPNDATTSTISNTVGGVLNDLLLERAGDTGWDISSIEVIQNVPGEYLVQVTQNNNNGGQQSTITQVPFRAVQNDQILSSSGHRATLTSGIPGGTPRSVDFRTQSFSTFPQNNNLYSLFNYVGPDEQNGLYYWSTFEGVTGWHPVVYRKGYLPTQRVSPLTVKAVRGDLLIPISVEDIPSGSDFIVNIDNTDVQDRASFRIKSVPGQNGTGGASADRRIVIDAGSHNMIDSWLQSTAIETVFTMHQLEWSKVNQTYFWTPSMSAIAGSDVTPITAALDGSIVVVQTSPMSLGPVVTTAFGGTPPYDLKVILDMQAQGRIVEVIGPRDGPAVTVNDPLGLVTPADIIGTTGNFTINDISEKLFGTMVISAEISDAVPNTIIRN